MKHSQVIRSFATRSLVPLVVLTLVLGWTVRWSVERIVIHQWTEARAGAWDSHIAPLLTGADLGTRLTSEQTGALDAVFAERLERAGVLVLKVFGRDGILLYSSDGDGVGSVYAGEPAIERAMAGKVEGEIADDPDSEESGEAVARFGRVIEVYSPLRLTGDGPVVAVVEVYASYETVAQDIRTTAFVLWGVIAVGLAALYVSQVGIVRLLESRIMAKESEIEAVNERLHGSMADLEEYSMGTLQALISAVDTKDSYTARHSLGVTDYAVSVGRLMGLSSAELAELERACLLHDIGKIGVSERVLLKPARLNDQEIAQIREHSEMGARIIESIPFLRSLVPVIRHHHEQWDGGGYPAGLGAEEIPRLARIMAVADAFDAMTSDRPYRPALRVATARDELVRFRGVQFDPEVVDAFLRALDTGEITPALYHPGQGVEGEGVKAG